MTDMKAYEQAAGEYMEAVTRMGESDAGTTFRSGSAETMEQKAAHVAETSERAYKAGMPILEQGGPKERAWITGQFLAQSAADLEVATQLMAEMGADEEEPDPHFSFRSASGGSVAMPNLKAVMSKPMGASFKDDEVVAFRSGTLAGEMSGTEARNELTMTAKQAITRIVVGTGEHGQKLFAGLLEQKGTELLDSATSGRELVTDKLDEVKEGTGAAAKGSIDTVTRLLLTAYDRLLAIVGRDAQDEARQTVKKWLDEAESDASVFNKYLSHLYRSEKAHTAIGEWVHLTELADEDLNALREEVEEVAARYEIMVLKQAETFDKVLDRAPAVIALVKAVSFAPMTAVLFALRFGLLTTLVYAGYDYIGYEQGRFLDISEGVAEVLRDRLGVPEDATLDGDES